MLNIAKFYISDLATLFVQLVLEKQQVGEVLNFKNITKINTELATVCIHDLDKPNLVKFAYCGKDLGSS
jgi:hypothetical protein